MKIKKGGVFTTIDSKDFGIYQRMGFEKVVDEPKKEPEPEIVKEVKPEPEIVVEEPVIEQEEQQTEEPEPEIEPIVEEKFEKPKSKKKKK